MPSLELFVKLAVFAVLALRLHALVWRRPKDVWLFGGLLAALAVLTAVPPLALFVKLAVFIVLADGLYLLVRRQLLHIDMSFFLLAALLLLSAASMSERFIDFAAGIFGIVYEPLVVILLALFIILCLVTLLAVYLTRMRQRQEELVRRLAALELEREEERVGREAAGPR